jgi:hypothetical protein
VCFKDLYREIMDDGLESSEGGVRKIDFISWQKVGNDI